MGPQRASSLKAKPLFLPSARTQQTMDSLLPSLLLLSSAWLRARGRRQHNFQAVAVKQGNTRMVVVLPVPGPPVITTPCLHSCCTAYKAEPKSNCPPELPALLLAAATGRQQAPAAAAT